MEEQDNPSPNNSYIWLCQNKSFPGKDLRNLVSNDDANKMFRFPETMLMDMHSQQALDPGTQLQHHFNGRSALSVLLFCLHITILAVQQVEKKQKPSHPM